MSSLADRKSIPFLIDSRIHTDRHMGEMSSGQDTVRLAQASLRLLELSSWKFLGNRPAAISPQTYIRQQSTETYSSACRRWLILTLVATQRDEWVGAIATAIQNVVSSVVTRIVLSSFDI